MMSVTGSIRGGSHRARAPMTNHRGGARPPPPPVRPRLDERMISPTAPEPVTVVVTRRVKDGRDGEYVASLARLLSDARALPGYLGATIHGPPPGTVVPQPSRFRMALGMIAVVYDLVLSIGTVVAKVLAAPAPVRRLVTIVIEVFLMAYVLMPWITPGVSRWIDPAREVT
jgi:antibiotic biosynthesis monooxygenase (ABM) superfamily enzyme